jgi:chaperonin GroES
MFDAATLSNMQGGFVDAKAGIREKNLRFGRGEWKVLHTNQPLQQSILPIKYDPPSPVLFQLLGLLVEAGKEVASIKDVLSGETPATAPVGTTLALIEQGLQVFTSIYKRVHRCLKHELDIHRRLNKTWLSQEKYVAFFDDPSVDPKVDFDDADMDVLPVSDPEAVTRVQQITRAQVMFEMFNGDPLMDQKKIRVDVLEAVGQEEPESYFAPPPQPDPLMLVLGELEVKERSAGITEKITKSLKNIADAEAVEAGQQMDFYHLFLQALQAEIGAEQGGQGGVPGMEGQPGDPMGAGGPPEGPGGPTGGPQGLPAPPVGGGDGGGMVEPAGPVGVPSGAL